MDGLWINLGGVQIHGEPGHDGDGNGAQLVRCEVDADGRHAHKSQEDENISHAGVSLQA